MKKLTYSILAILICINICYSQSEEKKQRIKDDEIKTIFGRNLSNGGYGAFSITYSEIDHKDAIQFGGRGAWIIDHGLAIGFGGTGFLNDYHYDTILDQNANLAGGYGGLYIEPILAPRFPFHISFPILLGVGGITYTSDNYTGDYRDNYIEDTDVFLIAEPGVELEFNILKYFRIALGAYYRYTSNISLEYIITGQPFVGEDVLHGLSMGITFKFGKF
ncbi:hypothetical protein ES708_14666 [subsurface metagenome]